MTGGLGEQLNQLVGKHRRSGVLLDTNVLLLLLVSRLEPILVGGKRLESYGPADAQLLSAFTDQFERLMTTTTVLAETSNLLSQLVKGRRKLSVFERVFPLFDLSSSGAVKRLGIETLRLDGDVFQRRGYTDSGLVAVLASTDGFLLTDDLDLFLQAQRKGVDTVNFTHMREAAGLL